MRIHAMMTCTVTAALLVLLIAGCGGGGDAVGPAPGADTAALSGTVYEPAALETQSELFTAQQAGERGVPSANCFVQVLRERDQAQLRTGTTDARGHYRFEGLPAGESVVVRARLRSGAELMAQARLRVGECRADVDEDSTLATICRRLATGGEPPTTEDDAALSDTVAGACFQYQIQHRYRWAGRNGHGPDFADASDVERAAGELLGAATCNALALARQSRTQADCQQALIMLQARLSQVCRLRVRFDQQTRTHMAQALAAGTELAAERIAAALTRILGLEVTPEQARRALARAQQLLCPEAGGTAADICDAVAAACLGDGTQDHLRLRTRDQLRNYVTDLLAAGDAGA